MNRVQRVLYRSLSRHAKEFDRYPLFKVRPHLPTRFEYEVFCDDPTKKNSWYLPHTSFFQLLQHRFRNPVRGSRSLFLSLPRSFRIETELQKDSRFWRTGVMSAKLFAPRYTRSMPYFSHFQSPWYDQLDQLIPDRTSPPMLVPTQMIEPGSILLAHPRVGMGSEFLVFCVFLRVLILTSSENRCANPQTRFRRHVRSYSKSTAWWARP